MSTITYLTSLVQQAIGRLNNYEANAKKVDELPHQTTLEPTSKIPVSRAGISEHLTVQQIIDSIQNGNYNQLLAVGTITVDGTDIIVPTGVSGQINGSLYGTSAETTIPITLCDAGFNRKDILVLTTSNTVIAISGEETDGAIVLAPPTPIDTVYITEFDVNDTSIGEPIDPILGTSFVKKSFSQPFEFLGTGADAVIPLSPLGFSEIRLTDDGLTSVSGVDLSLITGNPSAEVPYVGKFYIIYNLTGSDVTLKHNSVVPDIPFLNRSTTDIVIPNNEIIIYSYDSGGLTDVFKTWIEVDLSTKADLVDGKVPAAQLPSYVDDVLEYANLAAFPVTGETSKIYLALDTNKTYRWSGSAYVQLSSGVDFPSDGKTYGVKDGIATQIDSELHKNWHSIVARKESAGNLVTNANASNYASSGTVSVITAPGTSRRATFWFTNWLSAATAGALAGIRQQNSSETSLRSGYEAYFIFGNNDTNANAQSIIGFTSLIADFPNVDFSAYTGSFHGIGNEVGDANLSLIVKTSLDAPNSVAASYTKIPLGSNFPAHTTTDVYLAKLEAPQTEVRANQYIKISITNLINGATTSHIFESSLCPFLSSNVCFKFQRSARNSGLPTNIALLKYLFKPNHY